MAIRNPSIGNFLASTVLAPLGFALLVGAGRVEADEADSRLDHEQVFEAVRAGRIKPLTAILDIVARDFGDPVIEVEFEVKQGVWVYEIVTLGAKGRITEMYFDAATARLLRIKKDGRTDHAR